MNYQPTISMKLYQSLQDFPEAASNCYNTLRFLHILEQLALMKWRNLTVATIGHYLLTVKETPEAPDYLVNQLLPHLVVINDPQIRNLVIELAAFEASIDWYGKFISGIGLRSRNPLRKLETRGAPIQEIEDDISGISYSEIERILQSPLK